MHRKTTGFLSIVSFYKAHHFRYMIWCMKGSRLTRIQYVIVFFCSWCPNKIPFCSTGIMYIIKFQECPNFTWLYSLLILYLFLWELNIARFPRNTKLNLATYLSGRGGLFSPEQDAFYGAITCSIKNVLISPRSPSPEVHKTGDAAESGEQIVLDKSWLSCRSQKSMGDMAFWCITTQTTLHNCSLFAMVSVSQFWQL